MRQAKLIELFNGNTPKPFEIGELFFQKLMIVKNRN